MKRTVYLTAFEANKNNHYSFCHIFLLYKSPFMSSSFQVNTSMTINAPNLNPFINASEASIELASERKSNNFSS